MDKVTELIDSINSGLIVRWKDRGNNHSPRPYLAYPEKPVEWVNFRTIMAAIRRGWLKREDDGTYTVTDEGKERIWVTIWRDK